MAKRKDPNDLSPAYRKRLENYAKNHPEGSRYGAYGKAKKEKAGPKPAPKPEPKPDLKPTPPKTKPPKPKKEKAGPNPKAKPKIPKPRKAPSGERRGKPPSEWTAAYRKRIENFYKKNPDGTLTEARRGLQSKDISEMSELELTMWSQKVKLGNIDLRDALGEIDPEIARQGRAILLEMLYETNLMFTKYPAGTPEYYDQQDKLKVLYKKLKALGLVDKSGDIEHRGDVGYH